ncbi:MAG TPA: tetratricopeptide repeat protein, partial [Tepidisphaeraceae bacterium]|nr:tetratricopeptide repeat protein [Tepidisphaeraceae bacterium]
YRVEGLIHAKAKHSGEAQAAYEAAIQLDDRHAPLHYWLGQLLMREGDFDGAEKCLLRARLLSNNDPHVELEMARLLLFRGRFEDCRQAVDQLLVKVASVELYTRQAYDILLQTRTRAADAEVRNRRPAAALPYLEAIRTQYEAVPAELHDRKMKHTISKAIPTASRVERELRDGALASRAYEIRNWCETIHAELARMDALVIQRKAETAVGAVLNGVILRMTDRGFGFIKPIAKRPLPDVFFHREEVNGRWSDFHVGRAVSFELARDDSRRYFARNVQLLSDE